MRNLTKGVLSLALLFFLNSCGDTNDNEYTYVEEVNGPAGNFEGATEFVPEMFADDQTIYTYNEKDFAWIGVVFEPNGKMIYESTSGIEEGSTYTIVDGKMIVVNTDKGPTIVLDNAQKTLWKVTGEDSDGRSWQDTWHLELKFKADMLDGRCYISKFDNRGEAVEEKVCFKDLTFTSYNMSGDIKHVSIYELENNAITVTTSDASKYTLYLMSISEKNELNVWYVSKEDNYANNAVWVQTGL